MKKLTMGIAILMGLGLLGCATNKEEKKMEEKIAAEPTANKAGEVAERGTQAWTRMTGITETQRLALMKIQGDAMTEATKIQTELRQAKSVLFKTLATPNYKDSEIKLLKNKITQLDKQRLSVMFESLDKVEKIIGKHPEKEIYYQDIFFRDSSI